MLVLSWILLGVTDFDSKRIARTFIQNVYKYHRQKIYQIIAHYYGNWEQPTTPKIRRDKIMDMLGQYEGKFRIFFQEAATVT